MSISAEDASVPLPVPLLLAAGVSVAAAARAVVFVAVAAGAVVLVGAGAVVLVGGAGTGVFVGLSPPQAASRPNSMLSSTSSETYFSLPMKNLPPKSSVQVTRAGTRGGSTASRPGV